MTEYHPEVSKSIRNATDFVELCELYGYTAEEHVVQTDDGYLLGLHRLAWKRGEEDTKVNSGPNSVQKRVIYLHHGLLMNSEVWVCLTDAQKVLPFVLVERGFDVWVCSCHLLPGRGADVLTIPTAWKQSRQQVLQEVCPFRPDLS